MNPYERLESSAFLRTAVADRHFWDIVDIARPKHKIAKTDQVATAGSCFAQHISRRLRRSGFNFLDMEPAPAPLKRHRHEAFGYGMFSARFGNVYTSTQLNQLFMRANRLFKPVDPVWESGGRYFDPFRPSIEPGGFSSRDEVLLSRVQHLRAVQAMFRRADVFVFTLGLTETWRSRDDGAVYPTCPGTQAGQFDPEKHEFVNLRFEQIIRDMRAVFGRATAQNPKLRFILTVSPVPLTATASGQHVLTATTYSKSVLRAVAGQLCEEFDNVDYFPSYELITSPVFRGTFFDRNQRSIRPEGVDFVMEAFFREFCLVSDDKLDAPESHAAPGNELEAEEPELTEDDVICDEKILEFFAP